jgi:hypothetical protein
MKNSKMMHCHFGKSIIKIIFVLFIFWLGVQVGMVKSFRHEMRGNDRDGKIIKMQRMEKGQWNKDEIMRNVQMKQPVVAPENTYNTLPPKQ